MFETHILIEVLVSHSIGKNNSGSHSAQLYSHKYNGLYMLLDSYAQK